MLKLIPGGVALIAKVAMAPPVDEIVKPVADVLTVVVSEEDERVNAGAANGAVVGATSTTGTAPVVITGVIDEEGEVPSTLTAAIVNVYEVRGERLESESSPALFGETLSTWPVLILVIR